MLSIGFLLFLSLSLVNIQSPSLSSIESFMMDRMNHILQSETPIRIEYEKILNDLFDSFYYNCSLDLKELNPPNNKRNSDAKLPFLLDYIGKSLNDLADEIECQQSFNNLVYYVIVIFHMKNTVNDDDESLLSFLQIKQFSVAGCVTQQCLEPLSHLLGVFTSFKNKNYTSINKKIDDKEANNNFSFIGAKEDTYEKIEYSSKDYNYVEITIWIILACIGIKVLAGVVRLIYIPKGYEIHTSMIQHKQGKEKSEEKSEENPSLFPPEEKQLKKVPTEKKKDEFNFSSKYPLSFKIIHFFDLVEDMILLSTIDNNYYHDNGLGSIHFVRCCVLFFYVFFNTFNSLLLFPSKDILNKEFFSSNLMFIYRISTYSLISWVVLEAVLTSYKLMQFIKSEINKDKKKNRNKNLLCELLIVYAKYIFLFIPKIFMFIFSFFLFYYKVELFRDMFDAKITFEYIKDYIITDGIKCTKKFSCILSIFNTEVTTSKICYDFIFLYVNFLICTFIFMFVLLILLKLKNKIVEIAIIIINLIIFVGFIFLITDDNHDIAINYFEENIYNYYYFKGNLYLTEKVYLLLGVYHFGFILGLIYFNYQNIKENKDKSNRNKNEGNNHHYNNDNNPLKSINENSSRTETFSSDVSKKNNIINNIIISDAYYPFSFFNDLLKWISKIKYRIRFLILFFCALLIIILSNSYRFHGLLKKSKRKEEKQKGKQHVFLDNYDRDYVLDIYFDTFMYVYFLFEKHIFLVLFFIINIILITLSDKGFYKSIIHLKLIYAISRSGFIMVCLSYIFSTFSLCGFLVKIKFNIPTIVLISFGNFFITFMVSILLNAVFELQLKIGIKKILRKIHKKEDLELPLLADDSSNKSLT